MSHVSRHPDYKRFWQVPPLWSGETAFVICGGPSLRGFDFDRLRGRRVFPLKESCLFTPWAEFMMFCDDIWLEQRRDLVEGFAGQVITMSTLCFGTRHHVLGRSGREGIDEDPRLARGSWTVLHYALNALLHLGVARAVLLGADMQAAADGTTHYHKTPEKKPDPVLYDNMLQSLATTVEPLHRLGVEVVNCTSGGRLELWPRMDLGDILA
jgi:hypothetical protein